MIPTISILVELIFQLLEMNIFYKIKCVCFAFLFSDAKLPFSFDFRSFF